MSAPYLKLYACSLCRTVKAIEHPRRNNDPIICVIAEAPYRAAPSNVVRCGGEYEPIPTPATTEN